MESHPPRFGAYSLEIIMLYVIVVELVEGPNRKEAVGPFSSYSDAVEHAAEEISPGIAYEIIPLAYPA